MIITNRLVSGALFICATILCPPPIAKKSDRERAELRGPVKSVSTRWQANHKDDYGSVDERELGTTTYDEQGALIVDRQITPDFIRERIPNRHSEEETVFRSKMGNTTERYEFDSSGNMTKRMSWYSDAPVGAPAIDERMKYDTGGRVTERAVLGPDGKRFSLTLFTRDSLGDVTVEEDRVDRLKPPYPKMHYAYVRDVHRNWTSRIVTRENVPETAYEYRYAGNLFRTIIYFDELNRMKIH